MNPKTLSPGIGLQQLAIEYFNISLSFPNTSLSKFIKSSDSLTLIFLLELVPILLLKKLR